MSIYLAAYSGGMALGAVLGPVVAAGGGWQNNFYYIAPIAAILTFVSWKFVHVDESKKIHDEERIILTRNLKQISLRRRLKSNA